MPPALTRESTSGTHKSEWNELVWNLNIPPKVKVFLWRVFLDFIPVQMNLRDHHIPVSGLCERCSRMWGTTSHSLMYCDRVKRFWKGTIFWSKMKELRDLPMAEIGKELRRRFKKEDYEVWGLLWQRFGGTCVPRNMMVIAAPWRWALSPPRDF
ncbi:hypothetical protein C2S51_007036 [Perilla frutescens var. frutescens]|nr:hypothetical protein C2S51_007036 [Perilla frutescens var. frutescens]